MYDTTTVMMSGLSLVWPALLVALLAPGMQLDPITVLNGTHLRGNHQCNLQLPCQRHNLQSQHGKVGTTTWGFAAI